MGFLNWITERREYSRWARSTHKTDSELRKHVLEKVDRFSAIRLDEQSLNLLGTFRARLGTVYDEPAHDPELIASVEFNIFKRTVRAARRNMAVALSEHIAAELAAAEAFFMTGELHALIDATVDQKLDTLAFGASALYDFKIEEIRKYQREATTLPGQTQLAG